MEQNPDEQTQEQEKKEIDKVNLLELENKRFEEALKKKEELMKKEQEMSSRERLGGKSEAGLPLKTQADIQKEKDEADADKIYGAIYDLKKRRR